MVPIDFYDLLEMKPAFETTLSLNRAYLPVNDKNTIIKAINVMKQRYGFQMEFECILQKHIPTRAGLAGGSADAAAAIRMINRMLNLNMSEEDMISVGKEVGADVPFCLINKPAYVEGIGEIINPFSCTTKYSAALRAPSAKTPLDCALCVISKLSVSEKNITVCFPTTFPPLIE